MPFDSQGNFTRVMNWQEDAANSIPILASRHDDEDDNFANGFNEVMCRDGRTQMTGQLKMGSNKIVGLATGTANTDAVNKGQLDSALAGAVAGKQNTITGGASSITSSNLTANRALISNGSGKVAVSTTTNTELGYVHGVTSAIQTQIDSKQATITGAATTITGSNLTTNRALVSNGSGKVAVSAVTSTELGYLDGVTSAIQTQIDSKQATLTGAATTIASSDLTASRALVSNSSGKVGVSSTTATELGYVHGVTSAIQTQINSKQATITGGASTIASDNLTTNKALISNGSGKVAASSISSTELGYLSGVTSAIQTQLNNRPTATESKAQNGYMKFGNGIIIQWGTVEAGTADATVTLPTPFSSTNYSVSAQQIVDTNQEYWSPNIGYKTASSFHVISRGGAVSVPKTWIAIGY